MKPLVATELWAIAVTTSSSLGQYDNQVFLKVQAFLAFLVEVPCAISTRLVTGSVIVIAQNLADMP